MLDSIRKRKNNFIYSGIILVTAVVMGFYGAGKMGDDSKDGGVAAWVNGEPITQRELQQEMERRVYQYQTLFGGQFDPRMLGPNFPRQILESLVRAKLLSHQAGKLSFVITDEELADFIRTIPAYQTDGKFDAPRYTQMANRGQLEKGWRERLQQSKFQDYLSARLRLTPNELSQGYNLKETKIDLAYAKIDFPTLAKALKPTPKALADYTKATPESEFKSYYESHRSDYSEKAKIHIKQIRIGIPFQASESQKTSAKQRIDKIAAEVSATNFSDIAKKSSDDEYAKKGGDAGWVVEGALEKPLEEALAKLKPGEISPPIQAAFGYFILQLLERKGALEKPLESVKGDIIEKLYLAKHEKDFTENTRKRWDEQLAAGKDIQGELKAQKIETKQTGLFSLGQGEIPGIGNSESILDATFTLTLKAPLAKQLLFFQDKYYYVRLTKVDAAKPLDPTKGLDSVERPLRASLEDQLLRDWVQQLEKRSNKKIELKLASVEESTATQ